MPTKLKLKQVYPIPASASNSELTGQPTAPTPPTSDNSTKIATTEYVRNYTYANYLPLTGGTVDGYILSTNNIVVKDSGSQCFIKRNVDLERGNVSTSITSTSRGIISYSDVNNRNVGLLYANYLVSDANHYFSEIDLASYNPNSTDATFARIGVGYNQNGAYTVAPTPPTSSNDNNIATTAYVKSNLSSYLPLSGGTMTGSINYAGSVSWSNYMDSDKAALSVTHTNGLVTILSGNTTNQRFALVTYPGSTGESYQDWISLYSMPKSTFDSGSYNGSNVTSALKWNATTGELYSDNVSTRKLTASNGVTISGNHGFMNKGLILTGGAQNFAIQIQNNGVTKGTAPSGQTNSAIDFYGATMDKYQNRLANIESRVSTGNVSTIALRAYNTTSAEATGNCEISCNVDASGNVYTAAPTPATADNSTKIATTAFVKAQNYITSSSNITGNSATSTKLATARNISLDGLGQLDGSASFDGSNNVNLNASLLNCKISVGNRNNYPYHYIGTTGVITGSYTDKVITLLVTRDYINGGCGLVRIEGRTDNVSNGTLGTCLVEWIFRDKNLPADCIQVGLRDTSGDTIIDIFYKSAGTYNSAVCRVLQHGGRGVVRSDYTLFDSSEVSNTTTSDKLTSVGSYTSLADAANDLHSSKPYTQTLTPVDNSIVDVSNKLGTSNVGDANTPIYLNAGVPTSTGKSFANYLPLSGGTTTGSIQCAAKNLGSTYVNAAKDTGAIVSMTNTDSFGAWLSGYTKSYKVALATYPGSTEDVQLYSITKANVTAGTNTTNKTLKWNASTGALTSDSFVGALTGNVTGNCSGTAANVTGTVAIANGGTGATTRLNALKALTNEDVGTNATYFLTITNSWGKGGYTSVANAKTVLGLKSAAYTESSAYATSSHTHSTYAPLASPALTGTPKAPTAAYDTNSTQIATTAFVANNAARILRADTTIFVAYDGTGDGTTAAKAMSINDMWRYLETVRMEDASGGVSNSKTLTIKFVPRASSASYGNISFEASKMPGVRFLVIDTSTGTAGTTSNYTTNCPYFGNMYFRGPIQVTVKNVQFTGVFQAEYGASVDVNTYIGGPKFSAMYWGKLNFGNGVYNINNNNVDRLLYAGYYGFVSVNTATANFNFRELCRYTQAIFKTENIGYMYLNYARMKYTGTQPVVSLTASGTLSGTCSTAAGTAAKVLTTTAGNTTLANGTVIFVKFSVDNTASNPTLNVDGTGAKPIYFGSTNIPANYLNKTIQYKMTYNSTSGAWVCNNTFQRVEEAYNNSYLGYGSNYNTTYNSGSWNWTGFGRNWVSGVNINGTHYGGVNNYLPLSGGTVTGQLVLSKNTAGSGTAANAVALIVGGASTAAHLELDPNSIMAKSNGTTLTTLYLQDGNACLYSTTATFAPNVTNVLTLGASGKVWKQLFANTTTISTSDERKKQQIEDIPDEVLDAWGEVEFKQFKFNDAVEEKGNENARIHMGLIAQRIKEVFEKHNLDPFKYGFFCYDEWDVHENPKDENSPVIRRENGYALRYEEALIIEAAYQRRRLDRLEAKLNQLSN